MLPTYEIDGGRFSNLEEFYDEISRVLIPNTDWGRTLDALHHIQRGGFGTPEGGFILRWKNAQISRQRLRYPETVRQLQIRLQRCHPTNRRAVQQDLGIAQQGSGATVFDWVGDIIADHGSEGRQAEDRVELQLR